MATVDVENINFDVEISEESDLDIVLASIDESLEIFVTEEDVNTEENEVLDCIPDKTFVKEDNDFLVILEQHDVELTFAKDVVQTTIHKLSPKPSVKRAIFVCEKCTKNFQLKAVYLKHVVKTIYHLSEKIEKGNQQVERLINRRMMAQYV